ncbi:MAG TPA: hypothetical protein VHY08_21635 [Bacillota bacterium]|nr:hypothetical protein [Bacillota bacterium]
MINLLSEISNFRNWANEQAQDYGEWECDYEFWENIHISFDQFLSEKHNITSYLSDITYIIARDNECEILIKKLLAYPELFGTLCEYSVETTEYDAMWQCAKYIIKTGINYNYMENILVNFYNVANEYVKRLALLSLSEIKSNRTEELCKISWETKHQYQRIAVLWALYNVSSNELDDFLNEAKNDRREFLLSNREEIIKRLAQRGV